MESQAPQSNESTPPEQNQAQAEEQRIDHIIIRMWPKTPFLYPVAVFALICCILGTFSGMTPKIRQMKKYHNAVAQEQTVQESETSSPEGQEGEPAQEQTASTVEKPDFETLTKSLVDAMVVDRILGAIFLILLAYTLFTLCLNLEVRWALFVFSSVVVCILILYILDLQFNFIPNFLPKIFALSPMATPQFYGAFFVIWLIMMIISYSIVQFHYVKIESNEVIVVGGLLERQQRFSTVRMKYIKDIQDVFEYYMPLVNSGTLILKFPDQQESLVIENVLHIDKVIKQLDELSGYMQVN